MGKYRDSKRVAVQGGQTLLAKIDNLVKGGAITKPGWYDIFKKYPPMKLPYAAPTPQNIVFPEDRLFRLYKKRNPEWDQEVIKMHKDAVKAGYKTRGYLFCNLWQKYIEAGVSQEDAFDKVHTEFRAVEEVEEAKKQAIIDEQIRTNTYAPFLDHMDKEEKYVKESMEYQEADFYAKRRKVQEEVEEDYDEQGPS
mmetsp:Transcript_54063/g.128487  ORF Transcript_54063/g.128487 Transcript_54063/m.128487 type:complete len:195 (-) Transcript_54063:23-607(-)